MKAILIKDGKGPIENLYIGEEATPEPGEGEVQIKVSASVGRQHSRTLVKNNGSMLTKQIKVCSFSKVHI